MTKKLKQSGFTIIEALVAMMILAIAATSVISMFGAGARLSASRLARYELYSASKARLALLMAEVRSAGVELDRQFSDGGRRIEETARKASAADPDDGAPTLFEVTVVIADDAARNSRSATLTDFVVVRTSP